MYFIMHKFFDDLLRLIIGWFVLQLDLWMVDVLFFLLI